jgi:hypothetical protein
MDSPQNHIWGPHLWTILHSSAERIGLPKLVRLPQEESRIWTALLASLRYSLPCPQCKKHYTDYYSSTPILSFNSNTIRSWLYTLHNQVNLRVEKPNIITIEQISEIYNKPFNFTNHNNVVIQQMQKAVRLGWSTRNDIQRTIRLFEELKRLYDFF